MDRFCGTTIERMNDGDHPATKKDLNDLRIELPVPH
jgi:hypothetical protein